MTLILNPDQKPFLTVERVAASRWRHCRSPTRSWSSRTPRPICRRTSKMLRLSRSSSSSGTTSRPPWRRPSGRETWPTSGYQGPCCRDYPWAAEVLLGYSRSSPSGCLFLTERKITFSFNYAKTTPTGWFESCMIRQLMVSCSYTWHDSFKKDRCPLFGLILTDITTQTVEENARIFFLEIPNKIPYFSKMWISSRWGMDGSSCNHEVF